LIKKYGAEGTHVEAQRLAMARLAQGKRQPLRAPQPEAEVPAVETAAEPPSE
jgi:hypothetical protein